MYTAKTRLSHHRDAWQWRLWGSNARLFLETIQPYLKVKQSQAELALALLDLTRHRGGEALSPYESVLKDTLGRRLRSLNARGKEVVDV